MRGTIAGMLLGLCLACAGGESLEAHLPPGGFALPAWTDPHAGRWTQVDVTTRGVTPGGGDITAALQKLIQEAQGPTVLLFPAGEYGLRKITIGRSDLVLKGAGADKTVFKMLENGTAFLWQGAGGKWDYGYLSKEYQPRAVTAEVAPGAKEIPLADTAGLAAGDLVLIEADLDEWSYDAAKRCRGAVALVEKVNAASIAVNVPLALGLKQVAADQKNAIVAKLKPVRNVGLEGVRVVCPDGQGGKGSLFHFKRACHAWLRDVESFNPPVHHAEIAYSHAVTVERCFFDEAKSKGGGGTGYGVNLRDLSTFARIEHNILKDLRHAMATETGASYSVFGYNLVVDRLRDRCHAADAPPGCGTEKWINNGAENGITTGFITSDVCAHGNFPHHVLFEGNIFYNGVVDRSHKTNGPHLFFRNRPLGQPKRYGGWQQGAGLVVMGTNDGQVLVGNVLLNDSEILLQQHTDPRTSQGSLVGANVVKGQVDWGALAPNTKLPPSLYLTAKPADWPANLAWPPFGPDVKDAATNKIPALVRWEERLKK